MDFDGNKGVSTGAVVNCLNPTATPLPATATPLPPTATPLPATATPLPATPTPTTAGYSLEYNFDQGAESGIFTISVSSFFAILSISFSIKN
jgi:hypothetical protein